MRRLVLCGAAMFGVLAGCSAQPAVTDAEPQAAARLPLGAGDAVGWSVHSGHLAMTRVINEARVNDDH